MNSFINFTWLLLGFFGMEAFSWAFHKYLMHGFLWKIHKTHHEKSEGIFELNDVFSLIFGSIGFGLIYTGAASWTWNFWLGLGISVYGAVYFILHDSLVHQRFKSFARPQNRFIQAIFEAHKAHHRTRGRNGAESFGLLLVSKKFFEKK
jgi:beta-carotene 3-hydroxylase